MANISVLDTPPVQFLPVSITIEFKSDAELMAFWAITNVLHRQIRAQAAMDSLPELNAAVDDYLNGSGGTMSGMPQKLFEAANEILISRNLKK